MSVRLIHTLLCLFRADRLEEDLIMADECFKSLEKSTYRTIVVYNQGCFTNNQLHEFLSLYKLELIVIGEGANVGTTIGRQRCFEYIWAQYPDTDYISELHLDMKFCSGWEDPLVAYLDCHDEPVISCGIIDQHGNMPFLNKAAALPGTGDAYEAFLKGLCEDTVLHGFSNPCIHVSRILKETGGYHEVFLKGKQCFEDDSMLLGYFYYYGTRAHWQPKINCNSVVYHAIAGQRISVGDNVLVNFNGLVKQYGAMGIKHLGDLHKSTWHKNFFTQHYESIIAG